MKRALPLLLAAALGGCAPRPAPAARPPASPGEEGRVALYNLACGQATAGRTGEALATLEEAMAGGTGIVGFDLLASDPDLLSLHGEPRWSALLRRLSSGGEVAFVDGGSPGAGAVVVVLGEIPGGGAVPGALAAVPVPPYRVGPAVSAWTTRLDPGARAAETAVAALRSAEGRRPADPSRRILLASGEAGVRLAWEVLLREPGAFSRAVLDGPAPPRWALLDRGAERMGTEVLVAGAGGVPEPGIGVRVRDCGSLGAALKEALR